MNRGEVLRNLAGSDRPPVLVVENQSVWDIVKLIKIKHGKTAGDYDSIAGFFWAGNVYDTCENIWNFCKKNIPYGVESGEVQTVSPPAKILEKKSADCKHYSLFTAGVLDALVRQGHDINYVYRFASYNPFDDTPGHVFVVVTDSEGEIWIDPVLSEFDYHKPYTYAVDKKITATKKSQMSGIVLPHYRPYRSQGLSQIKGYDILQQQENIGATGQQTGQLLEKVSPALAVVPVVGWIAAAGGEVVGFFLTVFGSKYSSSTQVRWLTVYYERMVLGINTRSDNTVNAANVAPSQNWFSIVLGVPIYDILRVHALKGTNSSTAASLNETMDERVNAYLAFPDVQQAGVTYEEALAAAQISDTMSWTAPLGAWKGMTAAPALIDENATQTTASTGTGFMASIQAWMASLPSWAIPVGIVAIILLLTSGKKHK
jgi:hypothetical protein